MEKRYFFVVRYVPIRADCALLAGRCLSVLHGHLCRYKDLHIGVSFPAWSGESVGAYIAFISPYKQALRELQGHSYFTMMSSDGLFEVSALMAVPEGSAEVCFYRNQTVKKSFVAEKQRRLRRAKRRADEREEEFLPKSIDSEREFKPFNTVLMNSSRTGQQYLLHIQMKSTRTRIDGSFSKFGLATNQKYLGTVPELDITEPLFFNSK